MTKQQIRKIFFIVSICVGIIAIAVFSSIPLLVRSQHLEQAIIKAVKDQTGYVPAFKQLRVSIFPTPALHINGFELTPPEGKSEVPLIRADHAMFRPSLFSLLIGKPELAHVVFHDTDIHYTFRDQKAGTVKTLSLQDVGLDFWNLSSNRPIRFKLRGKFLNDSENISFEGSVGVDFRNFRVKDLVLKARATVHSVEFSRLNTWWGAPLGAAFDRGTFSVSTQLFKAEASSELQVKGSVNIQNLVYRIPPKPAASTLGNYQTKFNARIDLSNGSLTIQEGLVIAPFGGPFEIEAKLDTQKFSVQEILVKSKSLRPDALPQYLLSVTEILPVNLGFSGETGIDFFGKGSPELFTVNSRIDLTGTILNYSKYFSKPAGTPFFAGGDLKIIGGKILRGDFSVEFQGASAKGSLVGLDLVTGDCELTVLTNKFGIDGWEQYFPPIRQFQISGGVKVLTNLKGNCRALDKARFMNNISFDNAGALAANGAQIKKLNGSVDFGPSDAELHDIRFEIGNTPVLIQGKMLRRPEDRWLIGIQSPAVNILDLASQVHKVSTATQPASSNTDWDSLEQSLSQAIGQDEALEQFDAQIALGKNEIVIPYVHFTAFGGQVSSNAVVKNLLQNPETLIEFEIDRLNLARMQGAAAPVLYGNLFGLGSLTNTGPFDAAWLDRLKGRGSLSVTNGELRNMDILGGLGEIAELASLKSFQSGITRFNDIRGDFQVGEKKVKTDNLLIVSDDFEINGAGDLGFDGNLNFRLSVYLAPGLSQRISPGLGENTRLGPIPVLISGPVSKPSISKDPMLIGTFLQSLVAQQFSKITSRFSPQPPPSQPQPPASDGTAGAAPQAEDQPPAKKPSMEQALVDSGFNLLESFLSEKQTSS